jgi:transcription elongation factor Elf1
VSKLLPRPGKYECPACQREIYSRKRRTCEFCGAELPEEMRLSTEEIEVMEKEIEEIQAGHEQERERQEEEKEKAAAAAAPRVYVPPIGFV